MAPSTCQPLEAASLRAFRVPCLQFWDGATNPRTPPRASLGLGAVGRKDEIKHAGTLESGNYDGT